MKIACEDIQGIHRRHAMALAHQPAPGPTGQIVQRQITGISRHHVQRAACVAFGIGLEILGCQRLSRDIDPAGIGHMNHQPEPGAGEPVQIRKPAIHCCRIRLVPGSDQMLRQNPDLVSGCFAVLDNTIAVAPAPVIGAVRSGVVHRC